MKKETDILEIIKNLENRLWAEYGDPLKDKKPTQSDVHMTYYVGKLMEERGHKWVSPSRISGEKEDRAHYSEKALHEAFRAGMEISKANHAAIRKQIREEIKEEMISSLEDW